MIYLNNNTDLLNAYIIGCSDDLFLWYDTRGGPYILSAIPARAVQKDGGDFISAGGYFGRTGASGKKAPYWQLATDQFLWYWSEGGRWVISEVLGGGLREYLVLKYVEPWQEGYGLQKGFIWPDDGGPGIHYIEYGTLNYVGGDAWFLGPTSLALPPTVNTFVPRGSIRQFTPWWYYNFDFLADPYAPEPPITDPVADIIIAEGSPYGWEKLTATLYGEYTSIPTFPGTDTLNRRVGWLQTEVTRSSPAANLSFYEMTSVRRNNKPVMRSDNNVPELDKNYFLWYTGTAWRISLGTVSTFDTGEADAYWIKSPNPTQLIGKYYDQITMDIAFEVTSQLYGTVSIGGDPLEYITQGALWL